MTSLWLRLERRGIYYGWVIVGLGFLVTFTGQINEWILTILLKPMQEDLGWSRSAIVVSRMLSLVGSAAAAPIMGRIVDRYGARGIIVAASITQAVILLLCSFMNDLWHLYLLFIVSGVVVGSTLVGIAPLTAVANWFVRRRGWAMAIALAGASFGGAIFVLFGQTILERAGWRMVWMSLAIMPLIFTVGPVWVLMKRRPEDVGLNPNGDNPSSSVKLDKAVIPGESGGSREISWPPGQAVRTRAFWVLIVANISYGLSVFGVFLHLPAYISDIGFSPATAALAMSLYLIAVLPGRFIWGFLAERVPVRYVISLDCVVSGLSLWLLLMIAGSPLLYHTWVLFSVVTIMGVFIGGFRVLEAVVWPNYYGRFHAGAIRGIAQPFQSFAMAVGPLVAAIVFDAIGTYQSLFGIFVGLYMVGGAIVLLAKPPLHGSKMPLPVLGDLIPR